MKSLSELEFVLRQCMLKFELPWRRGQNYRHREEGYLLNSCHAHAIIVVNWAIKSAIEL